MPALTPDESAEFAALTRALFAPGAVADPARQARYAELDARRREATPAPTANTEPVLTTAPLAEPARPPAPLVPPPPAPSASPSPAMSVTDVSGPRAPRAVVTTRTRVLSAVLGLAIAAIVIGVIGVVQWVQTPRPYASGTAVAITLDDLPAMSGSTMVSISADVEAGGSLYQVEGFPGALIVMVAMPEGYQCMYLAADDEQYADRVIGTCATGDGPIIFNYFDELLFEGGYPDESDLAGYKRIVIRNGEMTAWDDPAVDWMDY